MIYSGNSQTMTVMYGTRTVSAAPAGVIEYARRHTLPVEFLSVNKRLTIDTSYITNNSMHCGFGTAFFLDSRFVQAVNWTLYHCYLGIHQLHFVPPAHLSFVFIFCDIFSFSTSFLLLSFFLHRWVVIRVSVHSSVHKLTPSWLFSF